MALEYHGQFHDLPQDIQTGPEADKIIVSSSHSEEEMRAEVNDELSSKATRAYVDTESGKLVDVSEADEEFNYSLSTDHLGQTVAQLGENGVLPTSYFPPVNTRGAQFFQWAGTMGNKTSTPTNGVQELATLNVSGPADAHYMVLAWAQVEAKLSGGAQVAGLEVVTGGANTRIAYGFGTSNWTEDWGLIDAVPSDFNYIYTGSITLRLRSHRTGIGSANIEYSGYKPNFVALVVPVNN